MELPMDKEIEKEIFVEADKMLFWLLHRIREISGEFPVKVRLTIFYGTGENRTVGHYMEHERLIPNEMLEQYEKVFRDFEMKELIDTASNILKGNDDSMLQK